MSVTWKRRDAADHGLKMGSSRVETAAARSSASPFVGFLTARSLAMAPVLRRRIPGGDSSKADELGGR
jgi:hypothetical protein